MAVYSRGKKGIYWMRFRFAGQWIHESCRSQSKTLAVAAERQRRRQLEESYNGIKRRALPPRFEKAAAEWLGLQDGRVAPSTVSSAKTSLNHLLEPFGRRLLCDIRPEDVATYQQKRLKQGAQGKTVNIELGVFRQIMKANDHWTRLADKIKSLPVRKDVGRSLTLEEESRLLSECAKSHSACYTSVLLALNTAMRRSEIRCLQWCQIDLFARVLTVGRSKTDAGAGRVIPLNAAALKALADWGRRFPNYKPEHHVFPHCENKRLDPSQPTRGWRTAWRNALKRAGLKIRFHDLRHTAISKLAEGQASDGTIMDIAGHVSQKMLKHYSHIRTEAKRAALDAISTRLPDIGNGVNQVDNQLPEGENCAVRKLLN